MPPKVRTGRLVLRQSPGPSEADDQAHLARWLDFKGYLWCHCPNGEARDPRIGAKLKRMGVKRGVPDVLIFTHPPDKTWTQTGVAIEMKNERGGHVSREQAQWLQGLKLLGWHTQCCHGVREAIAFLQGLGY
jgi:hypothetical protein